MSDAYDLKPCPFCGGEASRQAAWQWEDGTYYPAMCGCLKCGIWFYGKSDYGHSGFASEEDYKVSMEQAVSKWNTRTPEQTIAATLGKGKLTEEQVRKVIRKYAADDSCYIFEVYGEMCRFIANDLNAMLGGGECELEIKDNMDDSEGTGAVWWECSSCHWQIEFFHAKWLEHAKFCPECGARIRKAVKR